MSTIADGKEARASSRAQAHAVGQRTYGPVAYWATLGVIIFAFQVYVFGSWIFGPNFVPTVPTGSETISEWQRIYFIWLQIAVPLLAMVCIWFWVVKPWLRDGKLSLDGMIALSGFTTFFWDMCMNYTSTALLYNSNLINFGSWTLGSWPGWTSPAGNRLPEPIIVTGFGYLALVVSQAFVMCWLLRKAKSLWPNMGILSILCMIVVGLTAIDSVLEMALIRSGVYAYPGGIRAVTLFAGETYQFPLTEGFLFGGLAVGAMAALWHFKDDKGLTLAERGIERMRFGQTGSQWIRFFSIYGFIHTAFFVLYMIPNQWLSTHSDPFPQGYPSYMINDMCVVGEQHNQCPGPGVAMPRPANNPF